MEFVFSNEQLALIFLGLGIIGSALNLMLVSTFYSDLRFYKAECYLLCLMVLSDLLMTMGVLPLWALSIVIDNDYYKVFVCNLGYLFAVTSVFCFSVFSMFAAAGHFSMLVNRVENEKIFNEKRLVVITTVVLVTTFIIAYAGTIEGLDPDFCTFTHNGNNLFRNITAFMFIVIPCSINAALQVSGVIAISAINDKTHYRRSQLYREDRTQITINIITFLSFLAMWAPYMINIWLYKNYEPNMVHTYAAIGMSRSAFGSLFYFTRKSISERFSDIMSYTFCQQNLYKRHQRHRRGTNYTTPGENANLFIRPTVIHDPVMLNTGITVTEV